jgi:excisionase family DNA binding protein
MELFTLVEAANELRMSPSTLKRHVAKGQIGYVVIGHGKAREHIRFRRDDLEAFQERQRRVRDPPRKKNEQTISRASLQTAVPSENCPAGNPRQMEAGRLKLCNDFTCRTLTAGQLTTGGPP